MLTLIVVLVACSIFALAAVTFGFDDLVNLVAFDHEQALHDAVMLDFEHAAWVKKQAFARAAFEANNKAMVETLVKSVEIRASIQRAKAAVKSPRGAGRMAL